MTLLYEGTKRVHATPMNRGDYNEYRGWQMPADENPADEGYLVEYVDGGKANDSRHAGYISWSPRDVFERAYTLVPVPAANTAPPHQQRVIDEKAARDGEIQRLAAFIADSPIFATLPADEQARLRRQLDVMRELSVILGERIAAF
ncbi:crAss001_48 related protein [Acidovorax sp. BL-A-41-H1]|uniref:crAss001_48 related protein n=1 Tax=Acidovorax sp. BL-A-41-H1 TaxID=3421102 RepID=UPI003F79D1AC